VGILPCGVGILLPCSAASCCLVAQASCCIWHPTASARSSSGSAGRRPPQPADPRPLSHPGRPLPDLMAVNTQPAARPTRRRDAEVTTTTLPQPRPRPRPMTGSGVMLSTRASRWSHFGGLSLQWRNGVAGTRRASAREECHASLVLNRVNAALQTAAPLTDFTPEPVDHRRIAGDDAQPTRAGLSCSRYDWFRPATRRSFPHFSDHFTGRRSMASASSGASSISFRM